MISRVQTSIGGLVKAARHAAGWDQAELAKRLGVGQQAVSNWERGTSRPRRDIVPQLADILEIDTSDLLIAAGYAPHDSGVYPYSDRPRIQNLPLADLPPDRFEHFVADFVQLWRRDWAVRRYGSQGHKQDGIDVIGEHDGRVVATFQCKRVKDFGPEAVRRAIEAVTVDADEHYLVLARPSASPRALDEIRHFRGWRLWDADEISRMVRYDVDRASAIELVDTYFPGLREPFLGVAEPSPWLTLDQFFAPFGSDQMFSHEWPLVGRQDTLDGIRSFAASGGPLGLLVGRGGIGKTRLLRELARTTSEIDMRFVTTTANIRPEHLELLPEAAQLLIIVDDAHERSDIADLVAGVGHTRPDAKLLFATRPYGVAQLSQQLRRAGAPTADCARWELSDLGQSEARELAQKVVGPGVKRSAINRLAALTADCPLITVLGAQLISRGQLAADKLESDEAVRTEVLRAFRDAFIADPLGADPDARRAVLDAVSILQPFRVDDPAFHAAIEPLTGLPYDRAKHHLRALEDIGVLLRRGTSLRIVPDLLGDAILADACLDTANGVSTGYLERTWQAVEGQPLQHVFVNASRVDWQFRRHGTSNSLVTEIWDSLDGEFRSSRVSSRMDLLQLVRKVAVFQPDRALRIVQWTLDNPIEEPAQSDDPLALYSDRFGYEYLLRELPPILKEIAYNFDCLPQALDLLWELAQRDSLQPDQNPDHAIRVLQDIAAFEPTKPVAYNRAVVHAVARWLGQSDSGRWLYLPFEILEEVLVTEGTTHEAVDPRTITITRFSINADVVQHVRDQALDLAFEQASSSDPRRAVQALNAIATSLHYPPERRADETKWTPVFLNTIARLDELARETRLDPIVTVAIRNALSWHASYSPTATKARAREVIENMPASISHELALLLFDGSGHLLHEDVGDHHVVQRNMQARFEELAQQLTYRLAIDERLDLLTKRLQVQQSATGSDAGNPKPFLWTLLNRDTELAGRICGLAAADDGAVPSDVVDIALGRLAEHEPNEAVRHAERLLDTGSTMIARHVANAFGWARGNRSGLIDGERQLLDGLASREDPVVRKLMIWGIHSLARSDTSTAIDVMLDVRLDDSAEVAEELFSLVGRHGELNWSDLPSSGRSRLISQLVKCPSINGYHVTVALSDLSQQKPAEVVALLMRRVEHRENQRHSTDNFEMLPYYWHNELKIRNHPQRITLLRQIRDWIAKEPNPTRVRGGGDIFRAVAGPFDDPVVDVLDEALRTGIRDQLDAVAGILRAAPRSLAWARVEFVARALSAARIHGEEHVRRIGGALHTALTAGVRQGTPGEPFAEDVEQRDRARKIASSLQPGSPERRLYESLAEAAERNIEWTSAADAELLDGRDW